MKNIKRIIIILVFVMISLVPTITFALESCPTDGPLTSCCILDQPTRWYYLGNNITSNGDCFIINDLGISLNCNDFSIIGNGTGNGIYTISNGAIKNCIISNFANGILLDHSNGAIIMNNKIYNNTVRGVDFLYGQNNILKNCSLVDNYRGVVMVLSDGKNKVYNNFIKSTYRNVVDDYNNTWNTANTTGPNIISGPSIGGNYWSDYTGQDLNGDGFGDTPYIVSTFKENYDYLPLVDINPPRWSNNQSSTPLIVSSIPSTFNIIWTDNIAVDKVFIEGNWSGSPQNYSMTYIGSGVYGYQEILPAGSFYWKSNASDTRNSWNVSDIWYFTIEPKTCGLSANNIDFSSVNPGDISSEKNVTLTNTGNSPTTSLTIKGNQWSDGGSNNFAVGQTHWNLTSNQNYETQMTALTTSDQNLGQQVSPGTPLPVYFKLKIPEGQSQATYTQTITFTGSC